MFLGLAVQVVMLQPRAHAHNDYEHGRPLFDALDNGFCSVEADVYLVGDELQVGHNKKDLKLGRTLDSLYLEPLFWRWTKFRGSVYPQRAQVTLLVDIKESGDAVWKKLEGDLEKYRAMLTEFKSGRVTKRAVTVILSGDRPIEALDHEDERLAFIDGRLPDLESKPSATLVPLVSDSYESVFKTSSADLSAQQQSLLKTLVQKAHQQGRRIRFWAAPDDERGWELMYTAGVDLINTDRLSELSRYLKGRRKTEAGTRKSAYWSNG